MAGVFGLKKVYEKQLLRQWNESNNYGYFVAGYIGGATCTIDRLDFSNETISRPPAQLSRTSNNVTGVSNNNYGYFAGGNTIVCTIDRLDFSNETTSLSSAQLTQARAGSAAVSNSNYGYFGGGYTGSGAVPLTCRIDRLDFSNETIKIPAPSLEYGRSVLSAVSSSNYGYFAGGWIGNGDQGISRLDFSNETVTGVAVLNVGKRSLAGVSNSNYGYFGGGLTGSSVGTPSCTIDRLDFSNTTTSLLTAKLTQARGGLGAVSNSNYGYFGGGDSSSVIDRLNFSNDTTSRLTAILVPDRSAMGVVSGGKQRNSRGVRKGSDSSGRGISSTYGYFAGGYTGSAYVCTIDRLNFSNETISATTSSLFQIRAYMAAVSNFNYGYYAAGRTSALVCTIERMDFSNETPAAISSRLTQARTSSAAVSNFNYGYFAGGGTSNGTIPIVCTIDRLDFSNETTSAVTSRLTQARRDLAAVSNSNYAYFAGGISAATFNPAVCTIDRLDFSNETAASVTSGLTWAKDRLGAVSNSNYGYFVTGRILIAPSSWEATTNVDRLDFSNETIQIPAPTITLGMDGEQRYYVGTVSNFDRGYIAGGFDNSFNRQLNIYRLDFTNETLGSVAAFTQRKEGVVGFKN